VKRISISRSFNEIKGKRRSEEYVENCGKTVDGFFICDHTYARFGFWTVKKR
jgi:hypothetical protein